MPFPKGHKRPPNSGRKKGSKNYATIEKKVAEDQMRQMILKSLQPMVIASISASIGERFMYKVHTDKKGRQSKPEIVSDPELIMQALAEMDGEGSVSVGDDYFFISTKPSNNESFKELLNRAFGKVVEKSEVDIKGQFSVGALGRLALQKQHEE